MDDPKNPAAAIAPAAIAPDAGAPSSGGSLRVTPEFVAAMAEVVSEAMSKQGPPQPSPPIAHHADLGPAPGPITSGACPGDLTASTISCRPDRGWRSRRLWVTVSALAGMFAQLPAGIVLPPVTQIIIGVLVLAYIVVQGAVDCAEARRSGE